MEILLLMLFVASLAPQALCQDVETRGTNSEKGLVDGGGQSRTIYSQARPLSPHRMMHFGKRPVNLQQPTILVPASFNNIFQTDGELQPDGAFDRIARSRPERYNKYPSNPYLFSIELDQGRTLQELPQELTPSFVSDNQLKKNLVYNLDQPSPSEFGFISEQQLQQVARAQNNPKFMRMLLDGVVDSTDSQAEDASSAGRVAQDNGQTQRSASNQQQHQSISVSTRSIQPGRGSTLNLPKAFIPSLLFDRHGSASSMSGFGSFNKKAEPKDNFFMHFGRK